MKIVIMGSGAIGSLYGGLLSLAGADVVLLVGRHRNVEAIQDRGLRILGVMGEHTIKLEASENNLRIYPSTKVDDQLIKKLRQFKTDIIRYIIIKIGADPLGILKVFDSAVPGTIYCSDKII